jgi:hypothetical protein
MTDLCMSNVANIWLNYGTSPLTPPPTPWRSVCKKCIAHPIQNGRPTFPPSGIYSCLTVVVISLHRTMRLFRSKRKDNNPKKPARPPNPVRTTQEGRNATLAQPKAPSATAPLSTDKTHTNILSPLPSPPLTPVALSSSQQPVVEISEAEPKRPPQPIDERKHPKAPPSPEFSLTPPSVTPGILVDLDPMALGLYLPELGKSNVDIRDTPVRKDEESKVCVSPELIQQLEVDGVSARFKSADSSSMERRI